MLVDLKTRKKEINATNSNLLHPSLFIVDRDSQSVVDGIFIEADHPLPNKHFAIFGRQGEQFDLDEEALAALELDRHRKGTGCELARMQNDRISAISGLLVDEAKLEVLRGTRGTAMLWLLKKCIENSDKQYA